MKKRCRSFTPNATKNIHEAALTYEASSVLQECCFVCVGCVTEWGADRLCKTGNAAHARELDPALEHAFEGVGERKGDLDEHEAGEEGLGELFVCD